MNEELKTLTDNITTYMFCDFCGQDFYAEISEDIAEHLQTCPLFPQHNKNQRVLQKIEMEYKLKYGE
jgi:hypothetical protein